MMSISGLFYIIGGQYLVSKLWSLVPISGFQPGPDAVKFLVLPVAIGAGRRHRRGRAAVPHDLPRGDEQGLRAHRARQGARRDRGAVPARAARTASIPILTGVVVAIPMLFLGSLLAESFFGIPGLGSYTIDAIQAQDFAVVRAMVFLGSVLYILGLPAHRHLLHLRRSARPVRVMPVASCRPTALVWLLVAVAIGYVWLRPPAAAPRRAMAAGHAQRGGMSALVVLLAFVAVGPRSIRCTSGRSSSAATSRAGRSTRSRFSSLLDVLVDAAADADRTHLFGAARDPGSTRGRRSSCPAAASGANSRGCGTAARTSQDEADRVRDVAATRVAGRRPRLRRLVARRVAGDGGARARRGVSPPARCGTPCSGARPRCPGSPST